MAAEIAPAMAGPAAEEASARGPSLRQKAASGVIMVIAQNLFGRASLFLGQLVLAHILLPADFGAVALASTITTMASAIVFFGIDQILQQRRHNARLWATQVFVLSLGFAVLAAIVMEVAGVATVGVFHDERLPEILAVNGVATFLYVLSTVPQATLQWQMRFKFLAAYTAFDAFLAQVLIIVAALMGLKAFAFFVPLIFTNGLRAVVYWRTAGVVLRPLHRSRGWLLLVRRGLSALGTRISNVTIAQGDFFILGLFAAKPIVGAYFFAFRLSSQPMTILSGSVTSVLFSSLLKIGDKTRRAHIAFYAAEMITAVTLPLCLLMAVVAGPVMWALFGEKWKLATPLVQILSIGMPFDVVSWPAAALLTANGEFKRTFLYQSWSAPLFLALVTFGAARASAYGVATGVAIYYVIHSMGYTVATFRRTAVGAAAVVTLFVRLFICSAAAFGPVYLLVTLPELHGQPLAKLALALTLAPLAYVAALFVFARRIFDNLLAQGAAMLRRYAPGLPLPAALAARSEA